MKNIIYLIVLITIINKTFSQEDMFLDKRNYYDFGKKFHAELHYLPTNSVDSVLAVVLFKFSNDLITFQKSGINGNDNLLFYSIPEVEAEFEDEEGIIRGREVWTDTVFVENYEATISKTDFVSSYIRKVLYKGNYSIDIRLNDQLVPNLERMEVKDTIEFEFLEKEIISKPFFAQIEKGKTRLSILRNNLNFSSSDSKIIIPVSYSDKFSKFHYELNFVKKKPDGLTWESDFNQKGFLIPKPNSSLDFSIINNKFIQLDFLSFKKQSEFKTQGIIEIDLSAKDMVPGLYELEVVQDGLNDTINYNFKVIWEDKPFILQKLRYAIEAMYYVLDDNSYKNMLDAEYSDYSYEILSYWDKEDPTKETIYNESMAEYFKRADFAIFNFKTLKKSNGIKTDRGKIYILYGKPSSTYRTLNDDKTVEIWEYSHLKKKFIFNSESNDNFKLVDIKKI